jgi:hypothetical protein
LDGENSPHPYGSPQARGEGSGLLHGKPIDERWLGWQLHPYGIRSRNLRIEGTQAKGYYREELLDLCLRYVRRSELKAMLDELRSEPEGPASAADGGGTPDAPRAPGPPGNLSVAGPVFARSK